VTSTRHPDRSRSRSTASSIAYGTLPTEALHSKSQSLHSLTTPRLVTLLATEERHAFSAVRRAGPSLARAADLFAATLSSGGRVIYAGAGTSGRLGVLDAAELPPTFGIDPRRVIALIAGGPRAVARAVEGAEDRPALARRALARLRLGPNDLLLAIAASGVTPFTRAALDFARARGARTLFLTCAAAPARLAPADVTILLPVGPELIAGSTRMKAATATKLALHTLSTAAMVRLGKVFRGRMVDLTATNAKLRARALRILADLTGLSPARAAPLLARAGGSVKLALAAALLDLPIPEARRRLAAAAGRLDALL
jgi:N-acetylmuramic acid 6-phosphate etherase